MANRLNLRLLGVRRVHRNAAPLRVLLTPERSSSLESMVVGSQSRYVKSLSSLNYRLFSMAASSNNQSSSSSTSVPKGKTTTCWACKKPVACCTYFCPHCDSVLKPAHIDDYGSACGKCSYFEMLGIPATFSVDAKSLEQNYKKLQMNLHPDKVGGRSKEEQELSAMHSSRLNEAFATLRSPVKRALYILEQMGIGAAEEGKTETDLEILTEAMEFREKLDHASSLEQLQNLKKEVTGVVNDVEKELAAAIGDTTQINHSVRTAVRMRYLEKVIEEIEEKLRKLM